MYYYDDYEIREEKESFVVVDLMEYEPRYIRISKSLIKEMKVDREPEMVAIYLAIIELTRIDTFKVEYDKKAPIKSLIKNKSFLEKISERLKTKCTIEYLINEIEGLKYNELIEYFDEMTTK